MLTGSRPTRLFIILVCIVFQMTGIQLTGLSGQNAGHEKPSGTPVTEERPDGIKVYRIGNGVQPPRAIKTPLPNFAKVGHKKITGALAIEGYVGADGAFHDAVIVKSPDNSLDADILAATKKWTFNPCTLDGRPVNCRMLMELDLHLN